METRRSQARLVVTALLGLSSCATNEAFQVTHSPINHVGRRTAALSAPRWASFAQTPLGSTRPRGKALSVANPESEVESVETVLSAKADGAGEGQVEKLPGMFEVGGGPTVILDDPPTEVYNKAITRTLQWVGATALFGFGLWSMVGAQTAEEFFAGYLVEQSLSVDNLFVFLLLFDFFKVPIGSQDRVLNWGIYGAVVMRAIMIGLGAAALQNFHAILLVFAGILVYSSVKVLFGGDSEEEEDMNQNTIVQFSRKIIDSTDYFDGDRFFTMVDGIKKATPLLICMIAVEVSDVVFAVDSIPAVFGVTENPLVVFTSNMFAIMGLRSLYTILSKAATDLKYLEPAVAVVLGFIGGKMIAEYLGYDLPTEIALAVVATLLSGGVGLSVWEKNKEAAAAE